MLGARDGSVLAVITWKSFKRHSQKKLSWANENCFSSNSKAVEPVLTQTPFGQASVSEWRLEYSQETNHTVPSKVIWKGKVSRESCRGTDGTAASTTTHKKQFNFPIAKGPGAPIVNLFHHLRVCTHHVFPFPLTRYMVLTLPWQPCRTDLLFVGKRRLQNEKKKKKLSQRFPVENSVNDGYKEKTEAPSLAFFLVLKF